MKRKNRLIASVLALAMVTSFTTTMVTAAEANPPKTQEEINLENAASYAESFVEVVYEDSDYQSGDVIPFYGETDQVSGYCVDILDDGQPNGYVIIKFWNGQQTVSEFVVEPGVENPYDQMAEEAGLDDEDLTCYSVGPTDYQLVDTESNTVYGFESEESSIGEFQQVKQEVRLETLEQAATLAASSSTPTTYSVNASAGDVISDNYTGTVQSRNSLTGSGAVSYCYESFIIRNLGKTYACSVVAMCNLMKYYYSRGYTKIDANLSTMYDAIWNYAGTNSNGLTTYTNIPGAVVKYLNSRGYSCVDGTISNYDNFIYWIGLGKGSLLSYNPGGNIGHTVFVVGYVKTTSNDYLTVIDGWNNYSRYLNYNGFSYSRKTGYVFNITN